MFEHRGGGFQLCPQVGGGRVQQQIPREAVLLFQQIYEENSDFVATLVALHTAACSPVGAAYRKMDGKAFQCF